MTVLDRPTTVIKETSMLLIHEALARGQHAERLREADRIRRAHRLASARRWQRKAEQARRQARLAAQAIHL